MNADAHHPAHRSHAVHAALADATRRRIVTLLLERDRAVGELAFELQVSQPSTSKHLRVLRDAGLVDVQADGQRRVYRLRLAPLEELDAWLTPFRRRWGGDRPTGD